MNRRPVLFTVTIGILAVIYGPILYAMCGAFFPMRGGMIQSLTPSLSAFQKLFADQGLMRSLGWSLVIGAVASSLALVFGTIAALYLRNAHPLVAASAKALIFLPFVLPPIMTGLAILTSLSTVGISRSMGTVALGHVVLILALAFRLMATRLAAIRPALIEAARDLGASDVQVFGRIVWPNLRGSMALAFVLCFALSFDETLVTILLTGSDSTFPIALWGMTRLGVSPAANAALFLLLVVSFAAVVPLARALRAAPRV